MNFDWEETFCPDAQCWYDGLGAVLQGLLRLFRGSERQHHRPRHHPGSVCSSISPRWILPTSIPRAYGSARLRRLGQRWKCRNEPLNGSTTTPSRPTQTGLGIVVQRIGAVLPERHLHPHRWRGVRGIAAGRDVNPEVNYLDADHRDRPGPTRPSTTSTARHPLRWTSAISTTDGPA